MLVTIIVIILINPKPIAIKYSSTRIGYTGIYERQISLSRNNLIANFYFCKSLETIFRTYVLNPAEFTN